MNTNGIVYISSKKEYNIYFAFGDTYIFDCTIDQAATNAGAVTCPNKLLNNEGIGSLQGTSETELITNNDSKMTIAVVVSIILTVFCAVVMFILYRKYKSTNNNMKENKDYDLEIFYSANTATNNYENQNYSNNPMESVSS